MAEPAETIHIELANPTGGPTLGMPAVITVAVNDDDAPVTYPLTLTSSSPTLERFRPRRRQAAMGSTRTEPW